MGQAKHQATKLPQLFHHFERLIFFPFAFFSKFCYLIMILKLIMGYSLPRSLAGRERAIWEAYKLSEF
jgi:hypothetical protein